MGSSEGLNGAHNERWFEAGLRFKCTGCGNCCTGSSGSVYLSPLDLERLAGAFRLAAGAFARKYTRVINGRRALMQGPASHDCVFLVGGKCTVYEARPTQCRTYPWWLTNIRDAQSWEEAGAFCEGINHPSAPIVPASVIAEQYGLDVENEAAIEERKAHP